MVDCPAIEFEIAARRGRQCRARVVKRAIQQCPTSAGQHHVAEVGDQVAIALELQDAAVRCVQCAQVDDIVQGDRRATAVRRDRAAALVRDARVVIIPHVQRAVRRDRPVIIERRSVQIARAGVLCDGTVIVNRGARRPRQIYVARQCRRAVQGQHVVGAHLKISIGARRRSRRDGFSRQRRDLVPVQRGIISQRQVGPREGRAASREIHGGACGQVQITRVADIVQRTPIAGEGQRTRGNRAAVDGAAVKLEDAASQIIERRRTRSVVEGALEQRTAPCCQHHVAQVGRRAGRTLEVKDAAVLRVQRAVVDDVLEINVGVAAVRRDRAAARIGHGLARVVAEVQVAAGVGRDRAAARVGDRRSVDITGARVLRDRALVGDRRATVAAVEVDVPGQRRRTAQRQGVVGADIDIGVVARRGA